MAQSYGAHYFAGQAYKAATVRTIDCKCTGIMKSTKVQALGAIALHATTDYTDDVSIVGLGPLNWVHLTQGIIDSS